MSLRPSAFPQQLYNRTSPLVATVATTLLSTSLGTTSYSGRVRSAVKTAGQQENPFWGQTIRAVGVVDDFHYYGCIFEVPRCRRPGVYVELLLTLAKILNFSVNFTQAGDEIDMFRMLRTGEADMTAGVHQLSAQNARGIRYATTPVDGFVHYLVGSEGRQTSIHFLMLKPFGRQFWLAMGGTAGAVVTILLFLGKMRPVPIAGKLRRYQLVSFKGDKTLTRRLLLVVAAYSSLLFLKFYPKVLTTILSHKEIVPPRFKTANELAPLILSKEFRFILTGRDTEIYQDFICPTDDIAELSDVRIAMRRACRLNPPLIEPIETQLISKLRNNPQLVTIISSTRLDPLRQRLDGLYVRLSGLPHQFRVFYFRANSTYDLPVWLADNLNTKFISLMQEYSVRRVARQNGSNTPAVSSTPTKTVGRTKRSYSPISLEQLQGAFWLLLGGNAVSFLFLLFDILTFRYRRTSAAKKRLERQRHSNLATPHLVTIANFYDWSERWATYSHSSPAASRDTEWEKIP